MRSFSFASCIFVTSFSYFDAYQSLWRSVPIKFSQTIISGQRTELAGLDQFGRSGNSTILKYLNCENNPPVIKGCPDTQFQLTPRQVYKAHHTIVTPELVSRPYLIGTSISCAHTLGLDAQDVNENLERFISAFSGNDLLPGLDTAYCTNYGCHSFVTWFGQLGDGRAMGIGEVVNNHGERYELQLKGSGRSPYSRGFDGRAVLRSSVREFLVSEAMHHLGVKTTRSLCVLGTGDTVRRLWYEVTSETSQADVEDNEKQSRRRPGSWKPRYPPHRRIDEPGAITCRISPSFLRFSHLELFAQRKEFEELIQLANFVCLREFPHLLSIKCSVPTETPTPVCFESTEEAINSHSKKDLQQPGPPRRYIELLREVTKGNAALVADWFRVGYTQGNMNSDNTLLAGRTVDYGPYGWVEAYDPTYQPFTSDKGMKFAFARQPRAMAVAVDLLGRSTFIPLIRHLCAQNEVSVVETERLVAEVTYIFQNEFGSYFWAFHSENIRRKLGLLRFENGDDELWEDLLHLMRQSNVDFTIFFRELSTAASSTTSLDALCFLSSKSFYEEQKWDILIKNKLQPQEETNEKSEENIDVILLNLWLSWLEKYLKRIRTEGRAPSDRIFEQNRANPKYVLRNWMAILAYEKAEKGDFSLVRELTDLLVDPYEISTVDTEVVRNNTARWYRKTPKWAEGMPGAQFYSCSS